MDINNLNQLGSLKQLHEIISHFSFAVIAADSRGVVVLLNKGAENIFGISESGILGKPVAEIFDSPQSQSIFPQIQNSLDSGQTWRGEILVSPAAGQQLILELEVKRTSLDGLDNAMQPFDLFIGRDITSEKKAQRDAFQQERLSTRGEMAAEIAHELNNFLSVVCGNLELMGMAFNRGNYENAAARIKSMKDGLGRITTFVEGLMSVSRPEPKREIFDLCQFMEKELYFIRSQPRYAGVEFAFQWNKNIPPIEGIPDQLRVALNNILENSIDAMENVEHVRKAIKLEISYSDKDNMAALSISDNGCGMSDENYGRIFRQHFTTKSVGHGFGLLAVKRIIKSHGGRVKAIKGPDGGACFTIELPTRMPAITPKPLMTPA